ncbi:hypothetical protein DL96DRAFT_165137 [Flagelloscypha sp. PMI_526]|nr:hypothetical protein DL96DRAFT_165137 [Flagelloscypha sp. PMI_526]
MAAATSPFSSGPPSPVLSPMDRSTALVLVHDYDEPISPIPDFADEEEQDELFEFPAPSGPQLSQMVVFIYLLAPLLKLGALLLPNTEFSLKYGLPSFLFFALLSAFARQIWYNLALYVRRPDMEYVIIDALARGRRKETFKSILSSTIRTGTRVLRLLTAAFYLREAVHSLTPLFPSTIVVPTEHALVILFAVLLLPISLAPSLASRRILYATVLSIVCFLAWLGFTSAAYASGTLQTSKAWLRVGLLWRGMTVTAFAFTSSPTLSLYASTKGAMQIIANPKKHRHYFRISASLSVAIGAAFMLPLVFFSAFPRRPETLSKPYDLKPFIVSMYAATLLLSVPFLLVTSPPLPLSERLRRLASSSNYLPISRSIYIVVIAAVAMVPHDVSVILSDLLMVSALGSTYFLPAVVHVIMHQIKRPLSIVLPQTHTYSPLSSPPSTPLRQQHDQSESVQDPLLQQKERSLQRKQLRRRIVWDLGVWILLIPVGGGGLVWMIGEVLGRDD